MLINAKKSTIILSSVMLFLIVASLVSTWLATETMPNYWMEKVRRSYVRLFDVNGEANAPTWFSSSILLISAILLANIHSLKKAANNRSAVHWAILSLLFTGFSLDETAMLHEMTIIPLRAIFHLSGIFTFGWILIGIVSVVIVTAFFWRFLFSLPKTIRNLFIWAAVLFVTGAIFVESITGLYTDKSGYETHSCLYICTL